MDSPKKKSLTRKEEVIKAIKDNDEIRIKDLAKLLRMWESNLRKKIKVLIEEGKVERFTKNNYVCVRIINNEKG